MADFVAFGVQNLDLLVLKHVSDDRGVEVDVPHLDLFVVLEHLSLGELLVHDLAEILVILAHFEDHVVRQALEGYSGFFFESLVPS